MVKTWVRIVALASLCGLMWADRGYADCGACGKSSTGGEHARAHAKVGHPAPPFTLQDTAGKTHSLSEILRQDDVKAVVLEWFNHDCPVCTRHGQEKTIIDMVKAYRDQGVVFFGVDTTHRHTGKESDINQVIEKWGVNYPVLTDFDGKVGHLYGAKTTPHMFIINNHGVVVYDGAVDDDRAGAKSATERTNYVTAALDQTLRGETVAKSKTKPYGCSVKYKKN